ncbi:MAG: hypothetical protein PHW72_00490 [Candidatus Pacebacteria bacterium]|nr:hypothetical protein [Candidatus Paceibacterota bacterium]
MLYCLKIMMKFLKTKKELFALLALRAEIDWPELPGGVKISENGNLVATLPQLIQYIFNFAVAISGLLAFTMIVYGGIKYMSSSGNPTTQKDATDIIKSALIGILLLLGSVILLRIVNPDVLMLDSPNLNF